MSDSTALVGVAMEPTTAMAAPAGVDPGHAAMAIIRDWVGWWQFAGVIYESGMSKQKSREAVLAVVVKGMEIGVSPMAALANIHFFQGSFVIGAHLQLGVASSRLGVRAEIHENTDKVCRLTLTRPGYPPVESSFTIEEARAANLTGKDNWKAYAPDMLYVRTLSRGLKKIAPEVFAGIYDRSELPDAAPAPAKSRAARTIGPEDVFARREDAAPAETGAVRFPGKRGGQWTGMPLVDVPSEVLAAQMEAMLKKSGGVVDAFIVAAEQVLRERGELGASDDAAPANEADSQQQPVEGA